MSDPITPLTPEQAQIVIDKEKHNAWILRVLKSIDQTGNTIFLDGDPDETISAHTARMALKHEFVGAMVSKMLDLIQSDHGAKAIVGDQTRAAAVVKLEQDTNIVTK